MQERRKLNLINITKQTFKKTAKLVLIVKVCRAEKSQDTIHVFSIKHSIL